MPESVDLSASMQDYLETILELEQHESPVRITDIANKLNIAKASVNQTVHKLKDMDLVRQQVYGPVELTDKGREYAGRVMQRHNKLRQFLVVVLGVDPQIAEKDACQMEHAISPETMERLTAFLSGYECSNKENHAEVEHDSNRKGGRAMHKDSKALSELIVGEKGKVVKVASKGTIRRRIMEMGITTGAEIIVKGFAPLGDPMELGIMGYSLSLRKSEASDILVEVL